MNIAVSPSNNTMRSFLAATLSGLVLLLAMSGEAQPIVRTNYIALPEFLTTPSPFSLTNVVPTNKPWSGTLALGLSLTRGNSRTLMATGSTHIEGFWDHAINQLIFDSNAAYGSDTGAETTESFDVNGQYNRTLSKRMFAGLRLDFFHDGISEIHYRVTAAPLIGYYAIKSTNTLLGLEFGPGYINTRQDGIGESYAILRFGERYEYKFGKTARAWQTVEVMPQINAFNNYLVNLEIGAEANITKAFTLRAVFQDYYNNVPATGRLANDLRLVTGVGFKF